MTREERQKEWDERYTGPNAELCKHQMPARPSIEQDERDENICKKLTTPLEFLGHLTKNQKELTNPIPVEASGLHVFAIKEIEHETGKYQAFIGYYLPNGNFHFIGIPVDNNVITK